MKNQNQKEREVQANQHLSSVIGDLYYQFLKPLLNERNKKLDRRLVRALLGLVMAIITHRHRNQGLVLGVLGGYLLPPVQALAGTKRISRLFLSR